mmetsp:Transcript_13595/g.23050  ORF Transcript_13595/g.23050 Transcript_13595/m.23050 type:complete len:229 (-) Transcript_13595:211-897(-)
MDVPVHFVAVHGHDTAHGLKRLVRHVGVHGLQPLHSLLLTHGHVRLDGGSHRCGVAPFHRQHGRPHSLLGLELDVPLFKVMCSDFDFARDGWACSIKGDRPGRGELAAPEVAQVELLSADDGDEGARLGGVHGAARGPRSEAVPHVLPHACFEKRARLLENAVFTNAAPRAGFVGLGLCALGEGHGRMVHRVHHLGRRLHVLGFRRVSVHLGQLRKNERRVFTGAQNP